jgi:glutathione synthase/RimK-type ligase-like ATP-grasp enzyme
LPATPQRREIVRVALATCAELPNGDEDGLPLVAALGSLGVDAVSTVWDDPGADWDAYELVVVRSTWDYAERREQFLSWARSLRRVLNAPDVLDWSTDKERYLTDLERAGVPVVPTTFVQPGEAFDPPGEPFVVKPAVSAGGRRSARFEPGEDAEELVAAIHAGNQTAMVQPFLGDSAETALVYIGGSYSHALRRHVPLPSAASDVLYLDETVSACEPGPAERAVADAALRAAPGHLLYARVDLARGPNGAPVVLELELAEPSLYLEHHRGSTARLAKAIAACLG